MAHNQTKGYFAKMAAHHGPNFVRLSYDDKDSVREDLDDDVRVDAFNHRGRLPSDEVRRLGLRRWRRPHSLPREVHGLHKRRHCLDTMITGDTDASARIAHVLRGRFLSCARLFRRFPKGIHGLSMDDRTRVPLGPAKPEHLRFMSLKEWRVHSCTLYHS